MGRTTTIRVLFAALAVAFFATPVALRAIGVTAESFENRPFAEAPRVSQGWEAFGQTTRFLTDRMPLRAEAVRANTRIWTDVFGTTPRYGGSPRTLTEDQALPFAGAPTEESPRAEPAARGSDAAQVLIGRDGWLFLKGEQDRSCQPFLPFGEALDRWRALVREVRVAAPRALLVVPPDKGSIFPEHLPDFADRECAQRGKRRLWDLLRAPATRPDVVGLRDRLWGRKRVEGDDLYARKDSHWTSLGSLTLVRALLDRAGRRRVRPRPGEIVDLGRVEYTGDLTALLGAPETDTRAHREVRRDPAAPRVPGRTVLVGDSYSDAAIPQLTPYFDDLQVLSWVNTPLPRLADEIRQADTVVLETVEREFTYRALELAPTLRRLLRVGRRAAGDG
jgi:alginate O-acetyltransferase complex protein AlgJ